MLTSGSITDIPHFSQDRAPCFPTERGIGGYAAEKGAGAKNLPPFFLCFTLLYRMKRKMRSPFEKYLPSAAMPGEKPQTAGRLHILEYGAWAV